MEFKSLVEVASHTLERKVLSEAWLKVDIKNMIGALLEVEVSTAHGIFRLCVRFFRVIEAPIRAGKRINSIDDAQ